MQGFFRILPTRSDENLPAAQRLRVFRFVVLLHILYHIGQSQHELVEWIKSGAAIGRVLSTYATRWPTGWHAVSVIQSMCLFVLLEIIEKIEARQLAAMPDVSPTPGEQREWSLPYVFFIAILAGINLLEWIGVAMMLDWKSLGFGIDLIVFLFASIWCVDEMRRLMNRQRARAAASSAPFPLTLWLLAIPLVYFWVSLFTGHLINEMVGMAIANIIIPSAYLEHAEGIWLFLNVEPYTEHLRRAIALSPLLWAVLMIYKANRFAIGAALAEYSPQRRRLSLGAGILLAFVWPSLPRWVFPRLGGFGGRRVRLSSGQWAWLALAAALLAGTRGATFWMWKDFTIYWRYQLEVAHPPLWLTGALYELMLLYNFHAQSAEEQVYAESPREPIAVPNITTA